MTWVGGDPNPGTAFFVHEDGRYEVQPQYCPGIAVAAVESRIDDQDNPEVALLAFASNSTAHPNAFVVLNLGSVNRNFELTVRGTPATCFSATRSSGTEQYVHVRTYSTDSSVISYEAPAGSVTTFFAVR